MSDSRMIARFVKDSLRQKAMEKRTGILSYKKQMKASSPGKSIRAFLNPSSGSGYDPGQMEMDDTQGVLTESISEQRAAYRAHPMQVEKNTGRSTEAEKAGSAAASLIREKLRDPEERKAAVAMVELLADPAWRRRRNSRPGRGSRLYGSARQQWAAGRRPEAAALQQNQTTGD
jgi:hypothetical protein